MWTVREHKEIQEALEEHNEVEENSDTENIYENMSGEAASIDGNTLAYTGSKKSLYTELEKQEQRGIIEPTEGSANHQYRITD